MWLARAVPRRSRKIDAKEGQASSVLNIKEFAMKLRLPLVLSAGVILLAGCQPPPATTVTVDPNGTAAAVTTTPGAPPVAVVPNAGGTGTTAVGVVAGGS